LYGFFYIWIKDFELIAKPLYYLFKKRIVFFWNKEVYKKAIKRLQNALTLASILIRINYFKRVSEIIIKMNISLKDYKDYFGQRDLKIKKVQSIKYKSGIWFIIEQKYDIMK
jgi:hypothetical protein